MSRFKKLPPALLLSTLWEHATGNRKRIVFFIACGLVAIGLELCMPLVIARLMNSFQTLSGEELTRSIIFSLGIIAAIEFGMWVFHGPSRIVSQSVVFRAKAHFQNSLFKRVTLLSTRWHRNHHSGETIDQLGRATSALSDFSEGLLDSFYMIVKFVGSAVILSFTMPYAGAVVMAAAFFVAVAIYLFDKVLIAQDVAINKRYNAVAAAIQDYLTNVSTIISLRLEERVRASIQERTEKIYPEYIKNTRLNELKWFTTAMILRATQTGVLLGYCLICVYEERKILVGTFFALHQYLQQIGNSFFEFTWRYGHVVKQSSKILGIHHIEDEYEKEAREKPEDQLPDQWNYLEIRDLTFSHEEDKNVSHISGISFELERGKRYAFVGESGSGKSTTLGLIRGINRAKKAIVVCDGRTVDHGIAAVGHHSTLIPQEPEIFSDTIGFNISLGIDADEAKLLEAVKLARFDTVFNRLPKGFDTNIAEKGVNLSGGEKQRLALARGFFFAMERGSDLVLLDEPTSSVDAFNERAIYENLMERFSDRVVISSLHKFHLLDLFDEIVVFAGGKIVQRGSKEQLIVQGGEFVRLWENSREKEGVARVA